MKTLFVGTIAVALSSTVAMAADLTPRASEPVAPIAIPFTWAGFYVGAQVGYAWGDSKTRAVDATAGDYGGTSNDPKGVIGGGFAGYNYQFNQNIVVGAEADINASGVKSSFHPVIANGNDFPAGTALPVGFEVKQQWFGSARLRLGYAFDRFLPYVTGGLAFGDIKTDLKNPSQGISASVSDTRVGWTVGAGLEYAVTDNIIARVEYRYADYGKAKMAVTDSNGAPGHLPTTLKTNSVLVGVSYKF